MPHALQGSAGVSMQMLTDPQAKQVTGVRLPGRTWSHTCPPICIKKPLEPHGTLKCISAKVTHWCWPCVARQLGRRCRCQLGHGEHIKRQLLGLHLKGTSGSGPKKAIGETGATCLQRHASTEATILGDATNCTPQASEVTAGSCHGGCQVHFRWPCCPGHRHNDSS